MSERVEKFRKRRSGVESDADPSGNFELEFDGLDKSGDERSIDDAMSTPEERNSEFDLEIGEFAAARGEDRPSDETLSVEEAGDVPMQFDAASGDAGEMSIGELPAESTPMEILVGSPLAIAPEEEESGILLAPLSRRFLAGLTDALVLLLGAAVFGVIFWRFCGRLSLAPLNIAVLGFVAVFLVFGYFGVFTAIASATPGLLWMGYEVRSMRGARPTVRESLWRAFGVLVSLSALMLGFVWAWVDSDNLTWHDRMSGTVITTAHAPADFAGQQAET